MRLARRSPADPTPAPSLTPGLRHARLAVAVAFFVNGAVFANWVPRIPDVKTALGLSTAALGTALLGMGAGAVAGSLVAGVVIERFSSRHVTRWLALVLGGTMWLPVAAPSWAGVLAALVVVGFVDALMDVAMNAHGVVVQARYGRSVMNSFHAVWSLGAAAGAVMGTAAVAAGVAALPHLLTAGAVLGLVGVVTGAWLLPASTDRTEQLPGVPRLRGLPRVPIKVVGLLGLVALCSAVLEGAPADWSALYLTAELGGSAALSGLGYAAFTAAMIAGRLGGDPAVNRWGAVRVVRAGGLLAAAGFGTVVLTERPLLALLGLALAGLAVSTFFPLAFSAAGSLPDVPPGAGIAMVSLVARVGFVIGPPLIGALADAFDLATGLSVTVVGAAAIIALAGAAAPAQRQVPQ